jgi:hypothetical protein
MLLCHTDEHHPHHPHHHHYRREVMCAVHVPLRIIPAPLSFGGAPPAMLSLYPNMKIVHGSRALYREYLFFSYSLYRPKRNTARAKTTTARGETSCKVFLLLFMILWVPISAMLCKRAVLMLWYAFLFLELRFFCLWPQHGSRPKPCNFSPKPCTGNRYTALTPIRLCSTSRLSRCAGLSPLAGNSLCVVSHHPHPRP